MRYTRETEIREQLQTKSRAELQVLLERLIEQQPDIQPLIATLLKLPATDSASAPQAPGAGRICTLDPGTIRSQVTTAFSRAGGGWGAASHAAMELHRLAEIGDHFIEVGQWANAQIVFATIAAEILPSYEELEDEDQIAGVLEGCIDGLVACLEAQGDLALEERLEEAQRRALLTSLFALWQFDTEYGGGESVLPDVFAREMTDSEHALVEQWVRQTMQTGTESRQTRQMLEALATPHNAGGQ
ncbi:MAG TPA: hypothetical protein VGF67_26395 [Ktedonobacteraceae bacterium]|jgi:hypothetical protein